MRKWTPSQRMRLGRVIADSDIPALIEQQMQQMREILPLVLEKARLTIAPRPVHGPIIGNGCTIYVRPKPPKQPTE